MSKKISLDEIKKFWPEKAPDINIVHKYIKKYEKEKIVIINRCSDKICEIIENIIEKKDADIKIILNANILDKKSKLRNLFEKEKQLICTPVYEDDTRSLNFIINNFLKDNKLNLSQEIKNILIEPF